MVHPYRKAGLVIKGSKSPNIEKKGNIEELFDVDVELKPSVISIQNMGAIG